MSSFGRFVRATLVLGLALTYGCALIPDEMPKKSPPVGLIATPPSYYSTLKAKYLGQKYQENLSRLVEKIVRNPKTANLQFANNIASVGGIGFFTHSAAKVADERYLEVILVVPETFEKKGDYGAKVHRLFSLYGSELLAILSSDVDIYREPEVAGYGLNLAWRTITSEPSGPTVALERAVAYFPKQEVQGFLKKEAVEDSLLREAVIFAADADGPMNLVSYRQEDRKPDFRPPIQEQILVAGQARPQGEPKSLEVRVPQPEVKTETVNQAEPPAIADKRSTAQPKAPTAKQTPEERSKGLSDKAKNSDAVASSPAAQSPTSKLAATPEENAVDRPVVQKPSKSASGTAEAAEAKTSLPTQTRGLPLPKTASAPSPASESTSEPKVVESRAQPLAIAKAESAPARQTATKEAKVEDLSETLSKGAKGPEPAGDVSVIETRQSPLAVRDEVPMKASSPGTVSTLSAKTPAPLEEKVSAPPALSKPEVKSTEETTAPTLAMPPKIVPSFSPPLEASRQAEAGERQSPAEGSAKEEVLSASNLAPLQAKTEEKRFPASSPVPDRGEAVVPAQEVARSKLPERAEGKVPPPSATKTVAATPSAERQTPTKEGIQAQAPSAPIEKPVAEKRVELPARPIGPPARQAVAEPVKEELALLTNQPSNQPGEVKSSVRSAPKMLKGYIIQMAFTDKDMAQRWAETLERRGYATSVTRAGGSGSIRVRIGNFPMRQDAERELQSLGKDGLSGIVLNLPDGYRPAESAPKGDHTVRAVPAAQ